MPLYRMTLAALAALVTLPIALANAQPGPAPAKPEMVENCPGLVAGTPPRTIGV